MIRAFFFLLFISGTFLSFGQGYNTKNKKAIKYFKKAIEASRQNDPKTGKPNFDISIALLKKSLDSDHNFIDAHLMLAEFLEYKGEWKESLTHYEDAFRINPNHSGSGSSYFYAGNAAMNAEEFDKAIRFFDDFKKQPKANPEMVAKSELLRSSCEFSKSSIANAYKFKPINMGAGVNTSNPEYFPTITVDGKTLLFTRRVKDSRIRGEFPEQEDFFVSNLSDKNIWMKAESMPNNINTANNEGAPTIGPDGRSLVFVACPSFVGENDYGDGRTGKGSCDFFYTKKIGNNWTNPINIPGLPNTRNWETQPSLSADGKTLYYIRGLIGKGGAHSAGDIYVSTLLDDGTWSEGKRLPGNINTLADEESVLIHPDGKTMYFASRGHIGLGGSDLYKTELQEDGSWLDPINLGYPINTKFDENSLLVTADGEVAFFASNREGGFGNLDIYYFLLPEHLRPTRTIYFDGLVFDEKTKKPLGGKFQLIDIETGKEMIRADADQLSGAFTVTLPLNREYALNVSYPGYLFYSKNFNMINPTGIQSIHMDVPLVSLTSESAVTLENVFFDLSKATLRKVSFVELNKLRDFMKANAAIKIEIGGHTDTRGDDKENQKLSNDRAKTVFDYLVAQGIDAKRMTFKGYGETNNMIKDSEISKLPINDQEAAHQRNRRTEYKIIK